MKKLIGITGGIATGKSVVTTFLKKKHFEVIDADAVVRELQAIDGKLYIAIQKYFGQDYFWPTGELDRIKLASDVFANQEMREKLSEVQDRIIHQELFNRYETSTSDLIFMDIPLLFERNYTGFDEIWLVYAPQDVQLKRLMKRNDLSENEAKLRLDSQMPIDEKRALATRIINNCDTIKVLEVQLSSLISQI